MKQYLELLNKVLLEGEHRDDRTGVGTRAIFGYQMRFNLKEGFPLITTKKLHTKSIIHELLWFLKGKTNNDYLKDRGVSIWNEWADQNGNLGPIYGHGWRNYGGKPESVPQKKPCCPTGKCTYLGVADGSNKEGHPLKKTWEGMITRCYDKSSNSYPRYGKRGVSVSNDWLVFENFARDAVTLPGYTEKLSNDKRYVLDKDTLGNGFSYSKETCCWVTDKENAPLHFLTTVRQISDGSIHSFVNISDFCQAQGISNNNFSDLWTGNKSAKQRCGFELVERVDLDKGVDQIAEVLKSLKENPASRRHLVVAWNPLQLDQMALPPCHCLFQFYVNNKMELSCQLYQRSCDVFLGLPFNIASYALLVHIFADCLGYDVGEFVWTGGDIHLYENHIQQATLQLTREPFRPQTWLTIKNHHKYPWEYEFEDFAIYNYQYHPAIPAPVAV